MSTTFGAVWVLPSGAVADFEQIEGELGSWLDGATRSIKGDFWHLADVADASLFAVTDDVGFDMLVVRFSSSVAAMDPGGTRAWLDRGFDAARGLGALFGLQTCNSDHFEPAWLREHVLIPLLMEEWEALRRLPVAAIWMGNTGNCM